MATDLDSSAVSDALDALGLKGTVDGLSRQWECATIAGRVIVVATVPVRGAATRSDRHLGVDAIERAESGDVIVVGNEGRTSSAAWGGLLSRAASHRGIAGVVVDGLCRDVQEAKDLNFPLWSRGATPRTARSRIVQVEGDSTTVSGIGVRTGDFIIADATGVVVIESGHVETVLALARKIMVKEEGMARAIDGGIPISEVLGTDYEELLARMSGDP